MLANVLKVLGDVKTERARSRLNMRIALALVCADVLIQDGLLAEMFAALPAWVWLLTRMDAEVLVEDGALPEGPRTVHASVRLLVGVDSEMLRQMRLLPEALPAFGTSVRSGIGMDAFVLQQGALLLKIFPARQALEQSQIPVRIRLPGLALYGILLDYIGQRGPKIGHTTVLMPIR
jgi:hypothetical protein